MANETDSGNATVDLYASITNPLLREAMRYRTERVAMNNPKGWHIISRTLRDAYSAGYVKATDDQYREAQAVLAILTITEG